MAAHELKVSKQHVSPRSDVKILRLVLFGFLTSFAGGKCALSQDSKSMSGVNSLTPNQLASILMVRPGIEDFDDEKVSQLLACAAYFAPNLPNKVRITYTPSGRTEIYIVNPKDQTIRIFMNIDHGMALIGEIQVQTKLQDDDISDPTQIMLALTGLLGAC
jgi:hypothetical protein